MWRRPFATIARARRLDELREAGLLQARAACSTTPSGARRRRGPRRPAQPLREQLPRSRRPPEVVDAARDALDRWGFGLASVRFICGTQDAPQASWRSGCRRSSAPRTRSSTRRASTPTAACSRRCSASEDAVDLRRAQPRLDHRRDPALQGARLRYANGDMDELEARLEETAGARHRMIATDGVFSMDGYIAELDEICDLADRHDALVMVDDSHAVGFVGPGGRGTHEFHASSTGSTSSPEPSGKPSADVDPVDDVMESVRATPARQTKPTACESSTRTSASSAVGEIADLAELRVVTVHGGRWSRRAGARTSAARAAPRIPVSAVHIAFPPCLQSQNPSMIEP